MICGLDEAGRGPLAGPVFAASVILPDDFPFAILGDSKKLTEKKREAAMSIIREKAFAWGIGQADNIEIDKINILQASLLAMRRAFFAMAGKILSEKNNFYRYYKKIVSKTISDGIYTPALPIPCEALIRADATVHAVMAASILAKTARDAEMRRFSALYPEYKYDKHKGYPTKEHKNILAVFGPSPIQRLTFKY